MYKIKLLSIVHLIKFLVKNCLFAHIQIHILQHGKHVPVHIFQAETIWTT